MKTPMTSEEKCARLVAEIRNILGNGITLSGDVIQYINSTFSNPTLEELQTLLLDDSNCEKDSLLELLFFPDESMQFQLEGLLETLRLRQLDESNVQNLLCREPLQAVFRFPDRSAILKLFLPQEVAPVLISRLHIAKHLDPKLCAAVNNHAASAVRNRYKLKIRNSRFSSDVNKIQFLCDFFERMEPESHDFNECLDFALSLLDEINENTEVYRALMAKKKFYLRSLEKAKQMDVQLQKNNPETLLLEGKRVILVDKADARKKMLIIDRISRAVYGKTEYFEDFHLAEDHLEVRLDQDRDIQDIIKQLS
jgi:hypothetical protein